MTSIPLMDSITTEFRISGRILQETWGGLKRTGWMNLIIVVTMASILSIFGTLFAFVMETEVFVKNIGAGLKISVYTLDDVDLASVTAVIKNMTQVQSVETITKEQAWDTMKKDYQIPDIQNPLPNTIHVQMIDQKFIEPMVEKLKELPGVEKVSYSKRVLQKLKEITKVTSLVGLAISAFLGTLTFFIISNTIHLLIEARSREIEILRMMGVGNWYIRLPFLFQGAFYGLIGALIAYIPLSLAEFYINELFQYFQFTSSGLSHQFVFLVMMTIGMVVGGGGATLAVHKYLKT